MNYLFYLEPYAFLLRSNDKTVVYPKIRNYHPIHD